ncbi:phage major capsid protein, P2 family [Novosphingobium sp. KACC 22771]|uniref:phage major capsid protein, P2 family n=1 Tax=Novosphingobium sp. KACC 22771 TaxID=3025670 RepID=UPI0023663072|nr:phage major capsid protein, P2 family [Novosphingobium sp. KACC 22771]WDF71463.1 phage major capsid protein, P2 family [Novosphingobium sp. KACC 22771]
MNPITLERFNQFVERIGEINGVAPQTVTTHKFTVAPSVQQTLVTRMQEDDEFLKAINIIPVDEQSGQKLGLGIGGTTAGRTNTAAGNRRRGVDPTVLDGNGYQCVQTNFDTALRYDKLDMWAKFPDFQARIRDLIVTRQALDRIMIGFNGTSAAAETDRVAHPLLQDVNIGWLQKMRTENAARVLSAVQGGKVAGKVSYGSDGDFASIDAMVYGAKEKLLPVYARRAPGLCVIVGDDLLYDKYGAIMNKTEGSLDTLARAAIMADKQIGGLPTVRVPFFPADAFKITTLNNLSLYYQDGKTRRLIRDEPDLDQVTDYQSSNEAYVVEDYNYACMVENIVQHDAD